VVRGSSSVSDLALPAMSRLRSGLIWRFCCGITAMLGFFDHAATITLAWPSQMLLVPLVICDVALCIVWFSRLEL
jgi:hypothetical protein